MGLTMDDEHAVITGAATRAEILEAIAACVRTAKRMPTRDGLSALSAEHEAAHRYLDHLCQLLDETPAGSSE